MAKSSKGKGKSGRSNKQLRFLFAVGFLTASGKGASRKVTAHPEKLSKLQGPAAELAKKMVGKRVATKNDADAAPAKAKAKTETKPKTEAKPKKAQAKAGTEGKAAVTKSGLKYSKDAEKNLSDLEARIKRGNNNAVGLAVMGNQAMAANASAAQAPARKFVGLAKEAQAKAKNPGEAEFFRQQMFDSMSKMPDGPDKTAAKKVYDDVTAVSGERAQVPRKTPGSTVMIDQDGRVQEKSVDRSNMNMPIGERNTIMYKNSGISAGRDAAALVRSLQQVEQDLGNANNQWGAQLQNSLPRALRQWNEMPDGPAKRDLGKVLDSLMLQAENTPQARKYVKTY